MAANLKVRLASRAASSSCPWCSTSARAPTETGCLWEPKGGDKEVEMTSSAWLYARNSAIGDVRITYWRLFYADCMEFIAIHAIRTYEFSIDTIGTALDEPEFHHVDTVSDRTPLSLIKSTFAASLRVSVSPSLAISVRI